MLPGSNGAFCVLIRSRGDAWEIARTALAGGGTPPPPQNTERDEIPQFVDACNQRIAGLGADLATLGRITDRIGAAGERGQLIALHERAVGHLREIDRLVKKLAQGVAAPPPDAQPQGGE